MPKPIYKYNLDKNKVMRIINQKEEKEITSTQLKQKKSDLEAELARVNEDIAKVEIEEAKIVEKNVPIPII